LQASVDSLALRVFVHTTLRRGGTRRHPAGRQGCSKPPHAGIPVNRNEASVAHGYTARIDRAPRFALAMRVCAVTHLQAEGQGMALADLFGRFLSPRDPRGSHPGETTTNLKSSYSERTFAVSGLATDVSVLGQIVKTGGVWEPHIMNLMSRLVQPHDVCLDIGANIGTLTMVLADLAQEGVVHSFEPSSINSSFLKKNIRQNSLKNAHVHAIGLGNMAGRAEFTNLVGLEGCSFVSPAGRQSEQVVESAWGSGVEQKSESVTIDTLDNWVAKHRIDRVDFVKMDVEGCELAVLEGGQTTFLRDRPKLIIELNRNTLSLYFGIEPKALYEMLSGIYPCIYIIDEALEAPPRRVTSFTDIEPLLDLPGHWWVDLLCTATPLPA
jgi:FkbM family methyltransferase